MKDHIMTNRRIILTGITTAAAALLSGCGTVLYPDRTYQENRGGLDPAIVILDGIGLFFFIIPGLVAFAVDFTTGAIYFPAGHEPGDRERTIFDPHNSDVKLDQREIERIVALKTGKRINLATDDVRVMELQQLDQFWLAYAKLSDRPMLAVR